MTNPRGEAPRPFVFERNMIMDATGKAYTPEELVAALNAPVSATAPQPATQRSEPEGIARYLGDKKPENTSPWSLSETPPSGTAKVPREIDRAKHGSVLLVWNDCMIQHETLEMTWPKLVNAMLAAAPSSEGQR